MERGRKRAHCVKWKIYKTNTCNPITKCRRGEDLGGHVQMSSSILLYGVLFSPLSISNLDNHPSGGQILGTFIPPPRADVIWTWPPGGVVEHRRRRFAGRKWRVILALSIYPNWDGKSTQERGNPHSTTANKVSYPCSQFAVWLCAKSRRSLNSLLIILSRTFFFPMWMSYFEHLPQKLMAKANTVSVCQYGDELWVSFKDLQVGETMGMLILYRLPRPDLRCSSITICTIGPHGANPLKYYNSRKKASGGPGANLFWLPAAKSPHKILRRRNNQSFSSTVNFPLGYALRRWHVQTSFPPRHITAELGRAGTFHPTILNILRGHT